MRICIVPRREHTSKVLMYGTRSQGRPWVAGWLNTEIKVRHRELNPDMVAHLSTNRARHWLTSVMEANALTAAPDHQPLALSTSLSNYSTDIWLRYVLVYFPSLYCTSTAVIQSEHTFWLSNEISNMWQWTERCTDGMHKSTVNVCIEQVGHGQNCAVTQRTQVVARTFPWRSFRLLFSRFFRTVIQKIHEQCKIPAKTSH